MSETPNNLRTAVPVVCRRPIIARRESAYCLSPVCCMLHSLLSLLKFSLSLSEQSAFGPGTQTPAPPPPLSSYSGPSSSCLQTTQTFPRLAVNIGPLSWKSHHCRKGASPVPSTPPDFGDSRSDASRGPIYGTVTGEQSRIVGDVRSLSGGK